ncbi:MAG: hypothetical protein CME65_00085 [Halobacteriovoraceae bacterium]|nr:hypothetical protein [Halobacteriovoraceae bacterium]
MENSLTSAARIGKFSGVSSGNIEKRDFSWIKFPKIDPFFFQNKFIEYRTINKKLKGINIDFSNSFNLERGGFYNEIKDLKINFYYYSYRDEDFKLLHTEVINSTIQAGVFEDVSISLENVPTELLEDTYFGHGEFIYSEIEDFFIPKLGRTYRVVLAAENAPT